jgi:hypothetical protein
MLIRYYLKTRGTGNATVVITDEAGKDVARLSGGTAAGINTVPWNMRIAPAGQGGRGGGGGRRGGPPIVDQLMPLGEYTATLTVAGQTLTQKGRIAKTQGWSIGGGPVVIR